MQYILLGEKKKDLAEERYLFGKRYGLRDILKYGGVGSPKVIYQSGVRVFDDLYRSIEGEVPFASFEHRRHGLIIRMNMNQRLAKVGILNKDLKAVRLIGHKVEISGRLIRNDRKKIVHRGSLEILDVLGQSSNFEVTVNCYRDIVRFFQIEYFENHFEHKISPNSPEKETFF